MSNSNSVAEFDSAKALDTIEALVKDLSKQDSISVHLEKIKRITNFLHSIHDNAITEGFNQGLAANKLKI